jgi:hypothetical protein
MKSKLLTLALISGIALTNCSKDLNSYVERLAEIKQEEEKIKKRLSEITHSNLAPYTLGTQYKKINLGDSYEKIVADDIDNKMGLKLIMTKYDLDQEDLINYYKEINKDRELIPGEFYQKRIWKKDNEILKIYKEK